MKQYQIKNLIGSGNFSSVYRVEDPETRKVMALKVMKIYPKIAEREAQILKMLKHPNVIQIYSFEKTEQQSKLLLEYIQINTLDLYEAQASGLKEEQVKCILFQAALGLSYIHSFGIIHRDIKPENLLIDKKNALLKIIDFGLAINKNAVSTDYIATRWYRGPENLLGTKQYTCTIDVFSLGCVIVQLYLGNPLFSGSTNLEQIEMILNTLGYPTKLSWPEGYKKIRELGIRPQETQHFESYLKTILKPCDPLLIDVLQKMLVLNPYKRISCLEIVKHKCFNNIHLIVPPSVYRRFQQDCLTKKPVDNKVAFKGKHDFKQFKLNSKQNIGSMLHTNYRLAPIKTRTDSTKSLELRTLKGSSLQSGDKSKGPIIKEKRELSESHQNLVAARYPSINLISKTDKCKKEFCPDKLNILSSQANKVRDSIKRLKNESQQIQQMATQVISKSSTGDTVSHQVPIEANGFTDEHSRSPTSWNRQHIESTASPLVPVQRIERMPGVCKRPQKRPKNMNFISPTNRINVGNYVQKNHANYFTSTNRNCYASQKWPINESSLIQSQQATRKHPQFDYNSHHRQTPFRLQFNSPQFKPIHRHRSPVIEQRKMHTSPNELPSFQRRFRSPQIVFSGCLRQAGSPQAFISPRYMQMNPKNPQFHKFQVNNGSFRRQF